MPGEKNCDKRRRVALIEREMLKSDFAKLLGDIISTEIEKPDGKVDMNLVIECEECLSELLGNGNDFTNEQLEQKLIEIKSKSAKVNKKTFKMRTPFRKSIIALCAVIVLIAGSVTVYAISPAFRSMVLSLLNLSEGTSIENSGITYIYLGEAVVYSNIEKMIEAESLDIMYPHKLPDGVVLEKVSASETQQNIIIVFSFNDPTLSLGIESNADINLSEIAEHAEMYEVNGRISYISEWDNQYNSITVNDEYAYYISSNSKDDLMFILNNLS